MRKKDTYFSTLRTGFSSLVDGIRLTFKHMRQASQRRKPIGVEQADYFNQSTGIVTTEYPYEAIPIPDNGRYRLHNEIDDCIVCDLCAKICPVNCIDIVPIKSPEEIGKTSDGTTKRIYAATFDIDMAKCCYCGLCTTVCPTECLTMTKTFDYSEFDIRNMTYHFTDLSPEVAEEKKKQLEEFEKEKQRLKEEAAQKKVVSDTTATTDSTEVKKVAFKPVVKVPSTKPEENKELPPSNDAENKIESELKPKPVFKPVMKKPVTDELEKKPVEENSEKVNELPKPKPVFKPVIKKPVTDETDKKSEEGEVEKKDEVTPPKPKPVFKPVIKPPKKDEE